MIHSAVPHAAVREVDPAAVFAHGKGARLIDVREPHEYVGELGHIEGAELVPLATLRAAATAWDRSREIVVVCRSGNRSGQGARQLVELGFTHVVNMVGGMLAWNQLGLPLAPR